MSNVIDQLKKVASENCGACGDAFAVGNDLSVVCWAMSDGSFQFAVDLNGKDVVGLRESEIDALMIVKKVAINGAKDCSDRRSLAAGGAEQFVMYRIEGECGGL